MTNRASGILMPVFSLPSAYGIGTFGREAYAFVDQLKTAKQRYWQILPLGPVSYGDSPYQSFSTFAGNPYFIDLELLVEEGLLTRTECGAVDFGSDDQSIDYEKMYDGRYSLLEAAFEKSSHRGTPEYQRFQEYNASWLMDYGLFMAVKKKFGNAMWIEWDKDIKLREPEAIARYSNECAYEMEFHCFLQYYFSKQWFALKDYANRNGIKIIGDLPIYVAMDSADTWARPDMFQFDEKLNPTAVAGVPKDDFSELGQLWGNPLYNWESHRNDHYTWWIARIDYAAKLYDKVRIDHFKGFDEYWSIPYGDQNALGGKWCKGPGSEFVDEIKRRLGNVDIIAEDLGVQSETLRELLSQSGYPGMRVMQFGFSGRQNSEHLPHNHSRNSVIYTGTHDNTTTLGWYNRLSQEDRQFVNDYCRITTDTPVYAIVTTAFQSVAALCVIPMQDYLDLDEDARVNTPSTLGYNWKWRMRKGQFTEFIQQRIARITQTYFRG